MSLFKRRRHGWRLKALTLSGCSLGLTLATAGISSAASHAAPSQPYKGQTLTVFATAPSGTYAAQYTNYYNHLAAAFKQATGATIDWSYYESSSQEVSTIETSVVSGSGPDVIGYGTSLVGTLAATGDFPVLTAANWKQIAGPAGRSAFFPAALEDAGLTARTDIGVPYVTDPYVLAYNTTDFKKAGIASPPTTWTQFVQDAEKIQKAVPGVYGTGVDPADSFDPWKNIYFLTLQLGGRWTSRPGLDPAGAVATLDSKQVQEAMQFYFSLVTKFHVAPKQSLTWNDADMGAAFTTGKIAMFPIANYGLVGASQGTPLQGHLAFAPLPTVPYGMSALPRNGIPIETETTGGYWAIPKYATGSERAMALEFDKISTTPTMQRVAFEIFGYMPVTYGGIQVIERYAPASKPFIAAAEAAQPTYAGPGWAYMEAGMETAINNVATEVATTGSYNPSYVSAQLATANAATNAHMGS
jgi:multiple sugar transport system substrate-binding protein